MASECPLWVTSGHDGGEFEISALPAKADIAQRGGNIRLVPEVDSSSRSKGIPFSHAVARRDAVGRRAV